MAEISAQHLIKRSEVMQGARNGHEPTWQAIRDLLYPSGGSFSKSETPGAASHDKVLDNTGEFAAELLVAALHGMLTNPATKWFAVRAQNDALNDNEQVAVYLEQVNGIMFSVFNSPRRNFAPQQHEKYLDLTNYGTGCMFIAEVPGLGPRFQTRALSEINLAENGEGQVDTIYRNFELTARQAVDVFKNNAGAKVIKAFNSDNAAEQDKKFKFLHCTQPRKDRDPSKIDKFNMPFLSAYVNVDEKHGISQGGYPEMPYTTPRWAKRPGESFGRGPGHKALRDTRMLQRTMKVTISGAELVVRPPLQVANDGVLGDVRMTQGGLTYVQDEFMRYPGGGVRPISTGAQPNVGEDLMVGMRDRIERAFYNHLLEMMRDPRMTATQVIQIAEETLRVLGPVLGRMESEDLGPMVERVFAILQRAGAFPPAPAVLANQELKIEYVSPVAKAQRLSEAKGIAQTMDMMGPFVQADPTIMDNVDGDKVMRHVADLFGWPKDTLRDMDRVIAIRKARTEEAKAQAGKQDMIEGAGPAAKLITALGANNAPAPVAEAVQ